MYRSIVVGAAGSPSAARAVEAAARLAEQCGATLHLVNVLKMPGMLAASHEGAAIAAAAQWSEEAREEADGDLRQQAGSLVERGIDVRPHTVCGDPAAMLCEIAEHQRADLIVVGNRGMHGARRMLGSVPNTVSHQAGCDVLIVRTT